MDENESLKGKELVASFGSSNVADLVFDIIRKSHNVIDSMEKSLDESDIDGVKDKLPYL